MADLDLKKLGAAMMPVGLDGQEAFERLKDGQVYRAKLTRPRNAKFHRKYFALLKFSFDHWPVADEGHKNFDVFRKNIAVLAGFYTQAMHLDGSIRLEAKSVNFGAMDEVEFEDLFDKSISVILKHVLTNYTKADLERVVLELLRFD